MSIPNGNFWINQKNVGDDFSQPVDIGAVPLGTAAFTAASVYEQVSNKSTDTSLGGGSPSNTLYPSQAAVKAYADAAIQGLSVKASVEAASAAALAAVVYNNGSSGVGATLTGVSFGALSVDGYTPIVGDRVLIKDQVSGFQNGIYAVTAVGSVAALFVLTRAADSNTSAELIGAFVFVEEGSTNANAGFVNTNTSAITIGTTAITFTQFSGAGEITAGTGLSKTGNTIKVNASTVDTGILPATQGGTGTTATTGSGNAMRTRTGVVREIFLMAAGQIPRTTTGSGVNSRESSTNHENYDVLTFVNASQTFAQILYGMPDEWDGGTVKFKFTFTAPSGSGNVVLTASGYAWPSGATIDSAQGTAQSVTTAAASTIVRTAATPAVTIGGSPAGGTLVNFEFSRNGASGSDTLGASVDLLEVRMQYTESTTEPSAW